MARVNSNTSQARLSGLKSMWHPKVDNVDHDLNSVQNETDLDNMSDKDYYDYDEAKLK